MTEMRTLKRIATHTKVNVFFLLKEITRNKGREKERVLYINIIKEMWFSSGEEATKAATASIIPSIIPTVVLCHLNRLKM